MTTNPYSQDSVGTPSVQMTRTTITATSRPRQQSRTAPQVSQGTSHSHGAAATTQSCSITGIRTRSTTLRPQSSDHHHPHEGKYTFVSRTGMNEITEARMTTFRSEPQPRWPAQASAHQAPATLIVTMSASASRHDNIAGLATTEKTTLHNLAPLPEKRKTMLCERSHRLSPSLPPLNTFPCLAMVTNLKRNTSQTGLPHNDPAVKPSPTKR